MMDARWILGRGYDPLFPGVSGSFRVPIGFCTDVVEPIMGFGAWSFIGKM